MVNFSQCDEFQPNATKNNILFCDISICVCFRFPFNLVRKSCQCKHHKVLHDHVRIAFAVNLVARSYECKYRKLAHSLLLTRFEMKPYAEITGIGFLFVPPPHPPAPPPPPPPAQPTTICILLLLLT